MEVDRHIRIEEGLHPNHQLDSNYSTRSSSFSSNFNRPILKSSSPPSSHSINYNPDYFHHHHHYQEDSVETPATSTKSKRLSVGALMDKLSSSNSTKTSPTTSKKHTPTTSGRHTPTSKNATGDFGEFLRASQLQEALERESRKAEIKLEKEKKRESAKEKLFGAFKHHHSHDGVKSKASKGKESSKSSKKDKDGIRRKSSDSHPINDDDDDDDDDEDQDGNDGRNQNGKGETSSNDDGSKASSKEGHFPGDIFFAERAQKKESPNKSLSRSNSTSKDRRKSSSESQSRPNLKMSQSSSSSYHNQLPSSSSTPSTSTSPPTSPPSKPKRDSSGTSYHLLPPALCGEVSDSDSTDEEAGRMPGDDSEAEREAEKELELEKKRSEVEIGNGKVKPFSKSLGGSWGRRKSSSSSLKKKGSSVSLEPPSSTTSIKEDLENALTSSDSDSASDADSEDDEHHRSRGSRSRSDTIKNNTLSDSQLTERASTSQTPLVDAINRKNDASSTASLKSWTGETDRRNSDNDAASTISGNSLASGGANQALSKPLLELEELELESFLKNFGRHTREVRVPASANFPRRRMPQWSDFRVPANEAALAAQQGKRVTVLSHVDRGLQALLESEGAGGAQPRHLPRPETDPPGSSEHHKKEKKKAKEKEKIKKKDKEKVESSTTTPGASSAEDGELEAVTSSGKHMKVHWDPATGFQSAATKGFAEKDSQQSISSSPSKHNSFPFLGMRKRSGIPSSSSNPGKSEKEAKSEAKRLQEEASSTLLNDGKPTSQNSVPDFVPKSRESLEKIDVHDEKNEYRPSRDEKALADEADWTLIEPGETLDRAREIEVDSRRDEKVDGIAFCIAYILALVERFAPEALDDNPDQSFRESKARSHLERVYLIAPFWENFLFGLRRLYRWDDPRRTGVFFMGYFVLWYTDLIPTAFLLYLMFNICRYRFFPPDASILHDAVRRRMSRGIEADKLANQLRRRSRLDVYQIYNRFTAKYGADIQVVLGDVADAHEMIKNLILWRNPTGTWRTLTLFGVVTTFVTLAPAHFVWKMFFFFIGFTFFCLMPLQSHYPRYRRPLSPIWWVLWGSPTDAQFAVQLLRRRHLENAAAGVSDNLLKKRKGDFKGGPSSAAHAVAHGGLDNDIYEEHFDQIPDDTYTTSSGRKLNKPKKLGSFYCLHHGVPGHLHVTAERLYFVGIHAAAVGPKGKTHKVCKTPLEDVAGLVKTKSMNLIFYRSAGLQVVRKDGSSIFFSNMAHRDDAFNLLLAVGSDTHIWTKV